MTFTAHLTADEHATAFIAAALPASLYEAYIASSGGLSWDGKPCPTWEALPAAIRTHWGAVAAHAHRLLIATGAKS